MQTIDIRRQDAQTVEVTVGPPTTTHTVTVRPEYALILTGGRVDIEALVQESFVFLLAREPNTSILRRFDLADIGSYFPEYERAIKTALESAG